MRIGIWAGHTTFGPVDRVVEAARQARDDGFPSFWLPQVFGADAMTALAVAGSQVPDLELGTAVVPIQQRHPAALASQALTVQSATGGRFTLGIGLSHAPVLARAFDLTLEQPVRYLREYLAVLAPLIREGKADFTGEVFTGRLETAVKGATPCPILLGALGPRLLQLAATLGDGTITWMTGVTTVGEHIVPLIRAAAERAERPPPRVVVGLPVCVTDEVAAARARADEMFGFYGGLPSYRAMLDREGVERAAEVTLIGDEAAMGGLLDRLVGAGADDLVVNIFGTPEERERTRQYLRSRV